MTNFQPVNSNPADGELITLCKILESVSTGGGGGDSDVAVGADGVTRVPLNVNAAGELKVNVEASIDADLADIENALATTNGILTTTAADTATIKTEAISIDNKLPALSSGRVPVEVNNAASQVYNYTITGALAASTVIIGPIDCSQFREISVHVIALGTGGTGPVPQVSNDGTNWVTIFSTNTIGGSASSNLGTAGSLSSISLYSARNFRIISQGNQTAGTTTLAVYASQQTTPKVSQNMTGSVSANIISFAPSSSTGFNSFHTLISAASTNATSVRASQGNIGTCVLTNTSLTFKYVKFFNLAVAPTMGTSTPVIQFPIAPNSTLEVSTAFAGLRLATGIAYAITGGSALLDTTAVGAGEVLVNLSYV
jgi:hypothetical protein